MAQDELMTPCWRNGRAYAQAQAQPEVENWIRAYLLTRASTIADLDATKASEQLQNHYPSLKGAIRISDLRDWKYWLTMMAVCVFFVFGELIAVMRASADTNNLLLLQQVIGWALVLPAVGLTLIYLVSVISYGTGETLWLLPKWFRPSWLHAVPVLWLALGLLAVNFWLVYQTGNRQSPFLPAFLAAALTVIGLPRENSKLILFLTICACLGGLFVCLAEPTMTDKDLQSVLHAWGAGPTGTLPFAINAITFGVAAVLTVLLRQFSFRIGQ